MELRYRVESGPALPGSFSDTASALCSRLARMGLRDVEVGQAGPELVVRAARRLAADVRAAAMPGKLTFYDWDANVTGRSGPNVPFAGATALFEAVEAASKMTPRAEPTDSAFGGLRPPIAEPGDPRGPEEADRRNDAAPGAHYYLFGSDRRLIAGPAASPSGLATARGRAARGAHLLKVPQGIVVIEAERSPREPENVKRYFVLEDDAELWGPDVTNPRPDTDRVTREPILTMRFSERGRMAFAALTRRIAQRASLVAPPAGASQDAALQRMAITLDDRVVSLATIDFREHPEGIGGSAGAQISGLGTVAQARRLARLLGARPLPGHLAPLSARH